MFENHEVYPSLQPGTNSLDVLTPMHKPIDTSRVGPFGSRNSRGSNPPSRARQCKPRAYCVVLPSNFKGPALLLVTSASGATHSSRRSRVLFLLWNQPFHVWVSQHSFHSLVVVKRWTRDLAHSNLDAFPMTCDTAISWPPCKSRFFVSKTRKTSTFAERTLH